MTSKRQDWQTPIDLYNRLNEAFGFMLDPCTTADNPLGTPFFFIEGINGLAKRWQHDAFVNPPYKQIRRWVEYACNESAFHNTTNVCLITSRTGTKVWQETIFPLARAVCFMKGRLHFDDHKDPATFDSALVVFSQQPLTAGQLKALENEGRTIVLRQ